MSTTAVIPNGTYFINARRSEEIYLCFADGSSNLTTWHFSAGTDQQWKVVGTDPSRGDVVTYTLQNVRYRTFAGPPQPAPAHTYVVQSQVPFPWFIGGSLETYLRISSTRSFTPVMNVPGGDTIDNNPVIMWGPDVNGEWLFRLALPPSPSPSPSPSSSSSSSRSPLPLSSTSALTSPSPSSSARGGLAASDKIAIAAAISTFIVAVIGLYFSYKELKRRKNKAAASQFNPVTPSLFSGPRLYRPLGEEHVELEPYGYNSHYANAHMYSNSAY